MVNFPFIHPWSICSDQSRLEYSKLLCWLECGYRISWRAVLLYDHSGFACRGMLVLTSASQHATLGSKASQNRPVNKQVYRAVYRKFLADVYVTNTWSPYHTIMFHPYNEIISKILLESQWWWRRHGAHLQGVLFYWMIYYNFSILKRLNCIHVFIGVASYSTACIRAKCLSFGS